MEKIVIGCDHAGLDLKENLKSFLTQLHYELLDVGTDSPHSVDYPDYAFAAGIKIINGEANYGILICGTGIGMCIAANKVKGIRAAVGTDTISTSLSRAHNDANILTLGARLTTPMVAQELVKIFLTTPFAGGRHQNRIDKICGFSGQA